MFSYIPSYVPTYLPAGTPYHTVELNRAQTNIESRPQAYLHRYTLESRINSFAMLYLTIIVLALVVANVFATTGVDVSQRTYRSSWGTADLNSLLFYFILFYFHFIIYSTV
ncbi:hypothetical protein EON65_30410 [archaeon]|nr:MAG: hypothetical protein EON65_30410 [archaeon]